MVHADAPRRPGPRARRAEGLGGPLGSGLLSPAAAGRRLVAPAERLAAAAELERSRLDRGLAERATSARQLARLARTLLRSHPTDPDLAAGVERLARRRFEPPHPATLPSGPPLAVWTTLSARDEADLAGLASGIVAIPDAASHPDEAARLVELLVEVPGEHVRAARSLEALAGHRPEPELALWRFRLAAAELTGDDRADPDLWDDLLSELRGLREEGPDELAAALHVAAAGLTAESHAPGAEWIVPTLGGRRLVNAYAARHRRPALADELSAVYSLLAEADRLPLADATDPLGWSLRLMSAADADGRFDAATEALLDALASASDRADLADALAGRAEIFQSPRVAARAAAAGRPVVLQAAERPDPPPPIEAPEPPTAGWSDLILRHGSPPTRADEPALGDAALEPALLAFFEAAGANRRAALGWLRRATDADADSSSQLQAWRHRDALDDAERARLADAIEARIPDDEIALADDAPSRGLGACLLELLPPGTRHAALELRLRVSSALLDASQEDPAAADAAGAHPEVVDRADPHSAANRLAAAADLLDEGRPDAAATILGSLLKRLDDYEALPQLVELTAKLLQLEEPPADLVLAVSKALDRGGFVGTGILNRLTRDPFAAFALHMELRLGGLDRGRSDALRTQLLQTWLGIWAATGTPPDEGNLHDPMHIDPALLPLAAARLAGVDDPIRAAARFLGEHPPRETVPHAYGAALLALAGGEDPATHP